MTDVYVDACDDQFDVLHLRNFIRSGMKSFIPCVSNDAGNLCVLLVIITACDKAVNTTHDLPCPSAT